MASFGNKYSMQNVCIENNTIAFFHVRNELKSKNIKLQNMEIKTFNYTAKKYKMMRNTKNITEQAYAILTDNAIGCIISILNVPQKNENISIFLKDSVKQIIDTKMLNNTNIFEEPICFDTLQIAMDSTKYLTNTNRLRNLLISKDAEQRKVVVDSRFANYIEDSISLDVNCNITEAYDALSDAKVFVGAGINSALLSLLMNSYDSAFIDVSSCISERDMKIIANSEHYFRMSGREMTCFDENEEEYANRIDWQEIQSTIFAIITNDENSPII